MLNFGILNFDRCVLTCTFMPTWRCCL